MDSGTAKAHGVNFQLCSVYIRASLSKKKGILTITILDKFVMIKNDPRKNVAAGTMMDQLIKTILRSSHPNMEGMGKTTGCTGCLIGILVIIVYNNPHITGHTWSPKYPKQPVFAMNTGEYSADPGLSKHAENKKKTTSMTACPELPSVRTWLNQMNTGMQWPEHSRPWRARRDGKG